VPADNVIGKVRFIVLPPSRWQGVGDHDPQDLEGVAAATVRYGLPLGGGFLAAWPMLWLGRRARAVLRNSAARSTGDEP
jgi:signal peptidase I